MSSLSEIREAENKNNFQCARNLIRLFEEEHGDNVELSYLKGVIDVKEFNFDKGIAELEKCLDYPTIHLRIILALSKAYKQLGNIKLAIRLMETLLYVPDFEETAIYELASIMYLMGDYKEVIKLLDYLKSKNTNGNNGNADTILSYYVSEKLKNDDSSKVNFRLNHICKHVDGLSDEGPGYFFRYTNLQELLKEISLMLNEYNPFYSTPNAVYILKMKHYIGFLNLDELTRDIKVVTNGNEIITAFPILTSSEFNSEEYLTSKTLRKNRSEGGIIV